MVNEVLRTALPDDWAVITLGNCAQIFRGGSPRPIQDYLTTSDQGINWIKIGDVDANAKYINSTEEKIIPEGVSCSRMVYEGDLILSNSMSFGRPYIMNIEGCIHDGWLVIQKYDKVFFRDYLYYLLSSELTMQQYVAMAAGSSVQNLNKEKVSNVVLPCPNITEQKKIAEALSNIDGLILNLQKSISKKTDVRQGTLQLLMSGKKRAYGFSKPWRVVSFDDICTINAPMVNPQESQYAFLPHIGNESIDKHTGKLLSYNKVIDDNLISGKYYFTENDVLYGKINPQFGKVAFPQFEGLCSADMYPITCKDGIIPQYLKQVLLTYDFLQFTFSLSLRSGMPKVNRKELSEYKFLLPEIEEQKRITSILTDMDSEIEILEEKLSKYQKIKQGMMEELLTGKVRLV